MPHQRSASIGRDRFFETVECRPTSPLHATSRQGSMLWACKPACMLSASIGSLQGLCLIAAWSEPS
jgi:hypothetical protein